MMPKFRKKPAVIDAFKLERRCDWPAWFHDAVTRNDIVTHGLGKFGQGEVFCEIKTLEGVMRAGEGDWIIKGIRGELYPCKSDIFSATYEPAEDLGMSKSAPWDEADRRPGITVDLKTAASGLSKVLGDDRRVVCVCVRAESIAVMIDHTKRNRPEIPSTWQGWPVEIVDHGPMAVMGGDPNA